LFKSIVWSSTIDYPNQVSTVLFVGACNWDCKYCYNKNLINNESIDFNSKILPKLISRQKFINHIVISGGECTCYSELPNIINTLKNRGFIIGIHTNGSNPGILQNILNDVNFVGMDIKAAYNSSYTNIIKKQFDFVPIIKSIELIIESQKEYEFRTTVYPEINLEECKSISCLLSFKQAQRYILQQYDNSFDNNNIKPYPIEYIKNIQKECNKIIPTIIKGW